LHHVLKKGLLIGIYGTINNEEVTYNLTNLLLRSLNFFSPGVPGIEGKHFFLENDQYNYAYNGKKFLCFWVFLLLVFES